MREFTKVTATVFFGAALLGLTACGDAPETPAAIIETPQGPVQGVTTDNPMITNFKGIPFAAPPVGDLRWRAPAPAPTWDTVRLADTFSPMCRQESGGDGGFVDRIIEGHGLSAIKTALIKKIVDGMPAQTPARRIRKLRIA